MMTLDVRTIVVVLLVTAVLMSATLALDLRRRQAPGLGRWNAGLALFAAGWLLMVLRGVVPPIIGVGVADALLLAGLCFQHAALEEFGGGRASPWVLYAPAAALFAALVPLLDSYRGLTLFVSGVYAAAFALVAVRTARLGGRAGPVRWLSVGILVAAAIALLARAVDIWMRPPSGMFTESALHGLAFILLLGVTVTSSFAFVVMQRRASEEALRRLAMHDGLTGLYNRRTFMELAERELARAARAGSPTSVLMLDLDHFKRINDEQGHAAGDRVLARFAALLRAGVRAGDLTGRYGGEEFCAVLSGTAAEEAGAVAERIRLAAGVPSASIGVAASRRSDCSLDHLLGAADKALYAAKRAGRNRVVVSAPVAAPSLAALAA